MSGPRPIEVFSPGEYIKDELEARGWNQTDLAEIMGRNFVVVNELIAGKRGITRQTAIELGDAFGTGPDVWMNLEATYRLGTVQDGQTAVARRAHVYKLAPVREMVRRKWIQPTDDIGELERQIADFFELPSIEVEPEPIPHAARKTQIADYEFVNPPLRAWLYRARRIARLSPATGSYSEVGFERAMARLAPLKAHAPETRRIATVLSECGIRFLVLEHLAGTGIDGTCFWLDAKSPVVAISLRYDRLDWFWFTLMHELGHVKNRDGLKSNQPVDVNLVGAGAKLRSEEKSEQELAADAFAEQSLVPQAELDHFIDRVSPLFSKTSIIGFAARIGVHPALVVGQLAWRGAISYAHSREMLAKVRHYVTESALTDGWGHVIAP